MIDHELHVHLLRSFRIVSALSEVAEGFVIEHDPNVPEEHVDAFHDAQRYLVDTTRLLIERTRRGS